MDNGLDKVMAYLEREEQRLTKQYADAGQRGAATLKTLEAGGLYELQHLMTVIGDWSEE